MTRLDKIHVGSVYRDDVRADRIRPEVAEACAAELARTHRPIGGVATRAGMRIGQMKHLDRADIDPFGKHPDAIPGPFIDSDGHAVPGPFIGLWVPNEPQEKVS